MRKFSSETWKSIVPFEAFNRDLKLLFISNFVGAIGDGLYVYLLPLYLREYLHASAADVGLLYSILMVSTALTIIPGGFLADHFDRKKVMILGWAVWVPLPLVIAAATYWTQILPVMVVYGFFLSGPAISAYTMTAARKDRLTITYTTISASWWLGYIFSPGIGGYLSTAYGFGIVFFLAFLLYAAATIILVFMSSQRAQKPVKQAVKEKRNLDSSHARKIVLLSLFFSGVFFFLGLVRPLTVQFFQDVYRLGSFQIGLIGSVGFLGSAVFSIWLGKIGDKRGRMIAAAIALFLGALSYALFTSFSIIPLLFSASFLCGSTYMLWALMGASVGYFTPEASRGRWISLSQLLVSSAASIAPFIGGLLYESSPYLPFYLVIGVSPLLALLALSKTFREEKPAST